MRVAWFCHSSEIGGAELCLLEAVTWLKPHGVESLVFLPRPGPLEARLRSAGVQVVRSRYRTWVARENDRSPVQRVGRAVKSASALPTLLRHLRRQRPDVVVSNTVAVGVGAVAARALRIPHLWYLHEFGREDMGLLFDWGEPLSLRLMNALTTRGVVVSRAVGEKFEKWIPAQRLSLVYNGVEVPARPPQPLPDLEGPLRLVTLGMKHPGKRQEDVIRAAALLADSGVDCRVTLAGREDPEYGRYLRGLVAELGVHDRVEIKEFVPDAYAEVEQAHVFVMSSRNEAFGRVTIEAMKLGRPVVGSDRAGTAEFIQDGWNGLLYRAEDPEDLARKLRILHEDRPLIARLAENARSWASPRFTLSRYAAEMYQALEATIADGAPRPSGSGRLRIPAQTPA